MYKICVTEKSALRQRLIQNALLAMMGEKPYRDISVIALCARIEIPRKSFYRYFDSLDDVLYSMVDEVMEQSFACMEANLDLEGFFARWQESKALLDALEKQRMSSITTSRLYAILGKSKYSEWFSRDEVRYSAILYAMISMVFSWHHAGMQQTPAEMRDLANSVLKFPEEGS